MTKISRLIVALTAAAVASSIVLPVAQAQYQYPPAYGAAYQPQPLYPYIAAARPRAYVGQPQATPRAYPYVGAGRTPRVLRRAVPRTDPALVEQLRRRGERPRVERDNGTLAVETPRRRKQRDNAVFSRRIVVRERPLVIEHQRVVDDPPIVVRRERVIDETQPPLQQIEPQVQSPVQPRVLHYPTRRAEKTPATPRVIRAEAEITVLGPDRMNIRLFRNRGEGAPPHD
ncbi:MAG: hypothetical protein ACR2K5_14530 [Pseudolabrys sp.]